MARLSGGLGLVVGRLPRQKKAPVREPGLENAMRVVLVRRGATQEAYPHRGRGAIPGATELKLRLWSHRLRVR
jgi:hypothetical protein